MNYYSFVDNTGQIGSIVRILKISCALTLTLKHKLRHKTKCYKKFGQRLRDPQSGRAWTLTSSFPRTRKFLINPRPAMTRIMQKWQYKLVQSSLNKVCVVCGGVPVEMHHVRKLRDLKTRKHLDWFTLQMSRINRKQIPLCKPHHIALHQNKFST